MLGPAPIVDFDGTLARLDVSWDELRRAYGVTRIADIWNAHDGVGWDRVRVAEERAATNAAPHPAVLRELERSTAFAILTNNAESAVELFLHRFPALAERALVIIGRESLAGPKTSLDVFERGFERCARGTAAARGGGPVVYVGDLQYELDFARRLGAQAYHVDEVESDAR
jgi:phosphoglycolate phosphatase-like HAD superfamily hydrolase